MTKTLYYSLAGLTQLNHGRKPSNYSMISITLGGNAECAGLTDPSKKSGILKNM